MKRTGKWMLIIKHTAMAACFSTVPYHGLVVAGPKEHILHFAPFGALLVHTCSFLLFIVKNC